MILVILILLALRSFNQLNGSSLVSEFFKQNFFNAAELTLVSIFRDQSANSINFEHPFVEEDQ